MSVCKTDSKLNWYKPLGTSSKSRTMLDKPSGRKADVYADYIGGTVGNEFIVGCGLDYNEKYRNLPYIGVMRNS